MPDNKPDKKEGIIYRQLGDESVLYDSETGLVHVLNLTAGRIWELCDGRHNIGQIEKELRKEFFADSKDSISADIHSILAEFKKNSLIKSSE